MSKKTILGVAALACAPLLVWAEGGFALGPDAKLHLTLDGQVRFDDNVRFLSSNEKEDWVFVAAPGLELNYNGGLSTGSITLVEQIIRYGDVSAYDGEFFKGVGEYKYEGALTKVSGFLSYQELSQGSVTIRNADQAIRHDVANASLEADSSVTAKTQIGVGLFYDAVNYPGATYADRESYGLPLDVYYEVSPKVDVSVGYRYRRSLVKETPSTLHSLDSKDHFFNVGARGEFTPKLNGQVRAGYGLRDFDETGSRSNFSFSGRLTYVYSPKASFDLSASNDFSNSATGVSQEVFSIRAGAKFEIAPEWAAYASLSYEATDYEYARSDDFYTGTVGVIYTVNEFASVDASYLHRSNESSMPGDAYDFSSNILSLGISLRY